MLIYQQVGKKDYDRDILESNIKTRLDLGLPVTRFLPIPHYYCEWKVFLGRSLPLDFKRLLCRHNLISPDYYDLYPAKRYKKLLHHGEEDIIKNKKTLLPERLKLKECSHSVKKILLGATLVPKPVAEYLCEKEPLWGDLFPQFCEAWKQPPCSDCIDFHMHIKRRRTAERILFLRFTGSLNLHKLSLDRPGGVVSKAWANSWVEYLFFDTDIFSRRSVSKNFSLPQPPGEIPSKFEPAETVMRISAEMKHILYTLYQPGYLSKPVLPMKDEALLNTVKADKLSAKIMPRLEKIANFLIKRLIVDSQHPSFSNDWLEFELDTLQEEKIPLSDPRSPKSQTSFKLNVFKADSAMSAHKFGSRPDTFSGPDQELHKATLGDIVFPSPQGKSSSGSASFRFGMSQPLELQSAQQVQKHEWISEEDEPDQPDKDDLSIGEITDKHEDDQDEQQLSGHN